MTDYDKFLHSLKGFDFTTGVSQTRKWIKIKMGHDIATYMFDGYGFFTDVKFEKEGTVHTLDNSNNN